MGKKQMTAVLIFANGVMEQVDWVRPYLVQATAVVAADGGSRHLHRLNHPPDVVIGDVDSLDDSLRLWLHESGCQFVTHPAAKDETDLELALLYAAKHYTHPILLFGALGGRLDQMLGNVLLLTLPALDGRDVALLTPRERAWLVHGSTRFTGQVGDVVSLLPLGGDAYGVSTQGLQWQLTHETLAFGPARGMSNVMVAETAVVTVASGVLLCVHNYSDK